MLINLRFLLCKVELLTKIAKEPFGVNMWDTIAGFCCLSTMIGMCSDIHKGVLKMGSKRSF